MSGKGLVIAMVDFKTWVPTLTKIVFVIGSVLGVTIVVYSTGHHIGAGVAEAFYWLKH